MARPLEGRKVALAEGRQLEELAHMLEAEGAVPLRCPMVNIVDNPDTEPILAWLRDLVADRFGYVILMTGEALRRLLSFAEQAGMRDSVITALGRTRTITRGPKPVRALKEIGLTPTKVAETPTTEGVIAALRQEPIQGQTIGLTLYGVPNPTLVQFLEQSGAGVQTVLPYLYAPAADADRVAELIQALPKGEVDVLFFTSSPQVERLYQVAAERNLDDALQQGLKKTCVAAIGPVVAETLQKHGASPDICPEQGFVMKNLVQLIKRKLEQEGGR